MTSSRTPIKGLGLLARVLFAVCIFAVVSESLIRIRHWMKYGGLWGIEKTYTEDPASGLRIPVANS